MKNQTKIMAVLLCLVGVAIIIGISFGADKLSAHSLSNIESRGYPTICLDGVEYWQTAHKLAPRFTRDGKIVLCGQ